MPNDLKKLIKDSLVKTRKEGKLQSAIQKSLKNLAENGINLEDMIVGGLAKSFSKLPSRVAEIIEHYTGEVPESGKWTEVCNETDLQLQIGYLSVVVPGPALLHPDDAIRVG